MSKSFLTHISGGTALPAEKMFHHNHIAKSPPSPSLQQLVPTPWQPTPVRPHRCRPSCPNPRESQTTPVPARSSSSPNPPTPAHSSPSGARVPAHTSSGHTSPSRHQLQFTAVPTRTSSSPQRLQPTSVHQLQPKPIPAHSGCSRHSSPSRHQSPLPSSPPALHPRYQPCSSPLQPSGRQAPTASLYASAPQGCSPPVLPPTPTAQL